MTPDTIDKKAMTEEERFEQLWANLKEQVKAARSREYDITRVFTNGERPGQSVCVFEPYDGSTRIGADVSGASCSVRVSPSGLLEHAAKCIAASLDIQDAKP